MVQSLGENQPQQVRGVTIRTNRRDGWNNIMAGLGARRDKTEYTQYGTAPTFTDEELSSLYIGEGMASRIIDMKPQDATRAWIEPLDDPDDVLINELKRLGAKETFRKAMSWARLYRGAVVVLVEKGAINLEKPISKNVKYLEALRVYSASRIDVSMVDIVADPSSAYFDEVEYYPIRMRNGVPYKVHASRCLVFKGEEAPDETSIPFKYKYWGVPVLSKIYDRLKNWGSVEKAIASLMLEFNIGKYTLSNLAEILSQNNESALELIYNRLEVINSSKSMINAVLLGEGEAFERDSAALSGVDAIMDRMMVSLSAVSGYPVTRLWGRSPAGQNSTGASDIRQYYDDVSSLQELWLEKPLQKLLNIIGTYTGVANTRFKFNSLWQPTEKEQAEIEKLQMETDNGYISTQVLSAEDVYNKRFNTGKGEITIDE